MQGPSPVAASGGHSSSRCAGLSLSRPLPLWSTGYSRAGSAIVAHGPSRSAACGILPDQGPNACPLHWQADSQPLRHQGSPHPQSYHSNLASAPKFRFLHIPYWHHLVYNLGPRIWANLEATKGEDLTPGLLLLRDQPPRGGFPADPTHVAPQGPTSGRVRQGPLTR